MNHQDLLRGQLMVWVFWGLLACIPLAALSAPPDPAKHPAQVLSDDDSDVTESNGKAPPAIKEDRNDVESLEIEKTETVALQHYVLDRFDEAVIDAPGFRGSVLPDNSFFHRYWYSKATEEMTQFHRRVILHDRSRVWRDMRDALTLPVPSKATFSIGDRQGTALLRFEPVSLLLKGKSSPVSLQVRCGDVVLWQVESTPKAPKAVIHWPDTVEVPLPEMCSTLTFEVGSTAKRVPRVVVAWGEPRIEEQVPKDKAPAFNVLYIVVDALRADSIGPYRTEFESVSPHMDALASEGTTFLKSFANGNTTLLSMNSMLLGGHPRAMDYLTLWWANKDRRPIFYKKNPPYVTRTLHDAGYITYGAVHNHLYFPTYRFSVDPGFDILEDCGEDSTDHPKLTHSAIEFIKANRDKRWMVQLNLIAPHQPYNPPAECLEKAKEALKNSSAPHHPSYLGEVCWADQHVGQLMKALKELELDEETIIVLTADHGEVMDRVHDCRSSRDGRRALHLHGITLYDEEIHIPIIFRAPGTILPQTSDTVAQHVDIVPTLLDFLGLKASPRMTGRSLKESLVEGGKVLADIAVYAERWLVRTVRLGGWKLIWHTHKDGVCPTVARKACRSGSWGELYHVAEDPQEHNELSAKHPGKLKELRDLLESMRNRFHEMAGSDSPKP